MNAIPYASASDIAAGIAAGTTTACEALEACIARIEASNDALNAVIERDFDAARQRARAADAALANGEQPGPLHGVPMTIKDTFEIAGRRTVVGEPGMANYQSPRDAAVVERLKTAGANIIGKTNTPRMALDVQTYNRVFGTTRNPWNTERTPGGSSGGATAALAAGLTPLEIGSDIAGSIRIPASWCGVYGHKPSYGIVPIRGHIPGPPGMLSAPEMCVAGPLARSARDLRLALNVISGPEAPAANAWKLALPTSYASLLADFRVGVYMDREFAPLSTDVESALRQCIDELRRAGVHVTSLDDLPGGNQTVYDIFDQQLATTVGAMMPGTQFHIAARLATLAYWSGRRSAGTLSAYGRNARMNYRTWARVREARSHLQLAWQRAFEDVDVILLPATPTTAIPHNQRGNPYTRRIRIDGRKQPYISLFRWIAPASVADLPATIAPIGPTADGLPAGIQIVANYGCDKTAIAFAERLESLLGGFRPPPGYT